LAADTAFLDADLAASDAGPAAITYGQPSFSVAGATAEDVDDALRLALGAFGDNGPVRPFAIMPRSLMLRLALLRTNGARAYGELNGPVPYLLSMPALASEGARRAGSPGNEVLCIVDADAVALTDDGRAEISVATDASVQFSSTPSGAAAPAVSLWQNGLVGVRVNRFQAWAARSAVPAVTVVF